MAKLIGNLPEGVRAIQHRGMRIKQSETSSNTIGNKRYIEEMFARGQTHRGINVLAGAAGAEFALESGKWKNGVFTASIIETLQQSSLFDTNNDGKLSIAELFHAVAKRVKEQTGGLQSPNFSTMENQGKAPILLCPGHYIQQKDWVGLEQFLKQGIYFHSNFSQQDGLDIWIKKAIEYKAPLTTIQLIAEHMISTEEEDNAANIICDTYYSLKSNSCSEFIYNKEEEHQLISLLLEKMTPKGRASCLSNYSSELSKKAVELGLDINYRDYLGNTVLMNVPDAETCKQLLKLGADVNAQNKEGKTALMQKYYDKEIVKLLLQHGANPHLRNAEGKTVMDSNNEMISFILEHAPQQLDINTSISGMSASQIRELGVDYAEARNGKRKDEQKAIMLYIAAAEKGDMMAQRWMGWRYRQGRGVKKDENKSRSYFYRAADQGDSAAAEALGIPSLRIP